MSITDELRSWAEGNALRAGMSLRTARDQALAIADRIDAEHKRAVMSAMNDALYHANDESMAELGWVRLPKDANGEYIHIGDVMEGVDKYDSLKKVTGEVTTISFDATLDPDDSKSVGIRVWSDDRRSYHTAYLDPNASVYRHHHAPTVEDVLREFALAVCKDDALTIRSGVVEEFAKRLQLAGDAS